MCPHVADRRVQREEAESETALAVVVHRCCLRALRDASTIDANCGGSMTGRPRHGDMLVRPASADTTKNAPTATAMSRIRLSSQSGRRPSVRDQPDDGTLPPRTRHSVIGAGTVPLSAGAMKGFWPPAHRAGAPAGARSW